MECLTGDIGLQGVTHTGADEAPPSGKWINDLPLISSEMIASIGSPDNASTLETWEEIERRAIDRITEDLHGDLRAKFACMPVSRSTTDEDYKATINTYLCDNLSIIRRAYMHLLGFEVLNDALYSHRANLYTLTNIDRTKDLQSEYFRLYQKYLKDVLPQVNLHNLFTGPVVQQGWNIASTR